MFETGNMYSSFSKVIYTTNVRKVHNFVVFFEVNFVYFFRTAFCFRFCAQGL